MKEKKKNNLVKFGLQWRATALIILLFLLPFSLIGLYFYSEQNKAANEQVFLSELNTMNSIGINMETTLRNLQEISLMFYQNEDFQAFLKSDIDPNTSKIDTSSLDSYFLNLFSYNKAVTSVTIRRMDGISYTSSSSYEAMSDEEFEKIMNQSGKITYMGIRDSSIYEYHPAFVFSRKLYDINDMSKVLGAIEFFVEKDVILKSLNSIDVETAGAYLIFSNDFKEIIYSNEESYIPIMEDFDFLDMIRNKDQNVFLTKKNGKKYVFSLYRFSVNPEWILVHLSSTHFSNKLLVIWLFISIILGCIVSFFFWMWLNKYIFERLNLLARGMKTIENKDYSIQIPVTYDDEISLLTKDFNQMSSKLEEMINQVYLAQLRQKDSEIKSLRAYINPHFLFNTLDTICWMSRMENAYETCSLVEALSHLFRQSLISKSGISSIEEEISYTKEYLKIQECRYSDSIDFEIHCDKALFKYKTINSVLQPLIENAIIHGFKDLDIKGKIDINIFKENDLLVFVIKNDGHDANLNELEKYITENNEGKKGMALFGVHNRIQLRFGKSYGLKFEKVIPHGLSIKVTQPLIQVNGEAL